MKTRVERLEDKLDDIAKDLTEVKVELSSTTQATKGLEDRLDGVDQEIALDRQVKHKHSNAITRHDGILSSHEGLFISIKDGIKDGFAELASTYKDSAVNLSRQDKRISRIEIMAATIITLGTIVASAAAWVVVHVGKLFLWW